MERQGQARGLAQAALGPIPLHCAADLPRGGEPRSRARSGPIRPGGLHHDARARGADAALTGKKLGPRLQAPDFQGIFVGAAHRKRRKPPSGGQALAALGAAAGEDPAAVFVSHARPEAVAAGANEAAGLICAFCGHFLSLFL
jgi:hypothetical protein